jgi:hypothetical protein
MNASDKRGSRPASASSLVRRIAVTMILSGLVFVVLWLMAFSMLTSLLASAGFCIVVAAASAVSDPVESVLDAIAAVLFGILGAITAFFAAIFSIFTN